MLGIMGEDRQPENVYMPADVARRLGISPQALRRLAAGYERAVGELPRDERGRLWPVPAVERLEAARNAVRAGRYASVERALSAGEGSEGVGAPPVPTRAAAVDLEALKDEVRALREVVEEQSRLLREVVEEQRRVLGEQGERLEAVERARELLEAAPVPDVGEAVELERLEVPDPPRSAPTGPAPVQTIWGRLRGFLGRR